jgi:hypothetical protein
MTPKFPSANFRTWRLQIAAVIRLEMKKTFFAKRGLWVYLLALAPVLLFMGRAIDLMRVSETRQEMAAAHPVSSEVLDKIRPSMNDDEPGMTIDDVIKRAGEPYAGGPDELHRRAG